MVRVALVSCKNRHLLVQLAYDSDAMTEPAAIAEALAGWSRLVDSGVMRPWCYKCGSPGVVADTMPTPHESLAAACAELATTAEALRPAIAREAAELWISN